jgi:SAM-dependent methyltransferase
MEPMMEESMAVATPVRLAEETMGRLRCPVCGHPLRLADEAFVCTDDACHARYPVVDGIPIVIDERTSVFSIADFLDRRRTTFRPKSRIERFVSERVPEIGVNLKAEQNYRAFADLLLGQHARPRVLVIGGSIVGRGLAAILPLGAIEFVDSDVSFGERTALIADAHDIPFMDDTFDGVIIQAVLEHVLDPYRCVHEAHRVLKPGGLVYAETPFMQQVHGGKYDFTRFTHLGHRRLFRSFDEVGSGAVCGPGMALAWAYQYFLLSFVKTPTARAAVKAFARLTAFWLKYFDYYLIDRPGTLDAASGYYFMGRKGDHVLSDRELLTRYRGAGMILPVPTADGQFS